MFQEAHPGSRGSDTIEERSPAAAQKRLLSDTQWTEDIANANAKRYRPSICLRLLNKRQRFTDSDSENETEYLVRTGGEIYDLPPAKRRNTESLLADNASGQERGLGPAP